MDGGYRLRNRRTKEVATLSVRGATFRGATAERTLASHAAAVAAMNEELVRLTKAGWVVEEIESAAQPKVPEPEPEPDDLDAVTTNVTRDGGRVTIDASESTVTRDQAMAALLFPLSSGCAELVIQDAQPYDPPSYQSVEPWCAALASLGSRGLERLVVDTYFQPLTRQACVYCGDITQVFRACPALRFAYVIGCAEVHALAHDALEDLTLMGEPLALEPNADRALAAAFADHGLPALRELHVAYPENPVTLLGELVASPRFEALRVLSIDGDFFDNEKRGLTALKKHRAALSKLERLYLPIDDVTSMTDEELFAIVPSLRVDRGGAPLRPAALARRVKRVHRKIGRVEEFLGGSLQVSSFERRVARCRRLRRDVSLFRRTVRRRDDGECEDTLAPSSQQTVLPIFQSSCEPSSARSAGATRSSWVRACRRTPGDATRSSSASPRSRTARRSCTSSGTRAGCT